MVVSESTRGSARWAVGRILALTYNPDQQATIHNISREQVALRPAPPQGVHTARASCTSHVTCFRRIRSLVFLLMVMVDPLGAAAHLLTRPALIGAGLCGVFLGGAAMVGWRANIQALLHPSLTQAPMQYHSSRFSGTPVVRKPC